MGKLPEHLKHPYGSTYMEMRHALWHLQEMAKEEVHSLELLGGLRDFLVEEGYVKWVPAVFGSNHQYTITQKGRDAIPKIEHDLSEYAEARKS